MDTTRKFRWSSLLDTLLVLVALTAINQLWFRHVPAFRAYAPHPYLLPIVLVGLFYGFREALGAVLLCNVFYTVQLTLAGLPWQAVFSAPDLTNLAAFLLAGVFFGEAGELYQRALHHHREKSASLEASLASAAAERDGLEIANRELGEWIRFGDVQLTEIHAAADDLFSFDEARVLEAAAPLALKIVGADQCSLYLFDRAKSRFWRRAQAGVSAVQNPATVSFDVSPFLQIRERASVVSVRDVEAPTSPVTFLAAAPVMAKGDLRGVLLIESMPLIRLTPYTLANLGFLSNLISRCLDQSPAGVEADVLSEWADFRDRVDQEVHAANRYNLDLSLLFMEIDKFDDYKSDLGPDVSETLVQQVVGVVEKSKRRSDVVSYQGNGRLALLMPQTPPEKATAFIERTKERIAGIRIPAERDGKIDVKFSLGTQALADSGLKTSAPKTEPPR